MLIIQKEGLLFYLLYSAIVYTTGLTLLIRVQEETTTTDLKELTLRRKISAEKKIGESELLRRKKHDIQTAYIKMN